MMLKNGPGDPKWGWQMLMHDLRNPPQPEQPITQPATQTQQVQQPVTTPQQPTQQVQQPSAPQQISNIVNYPPMQNVPTQLKRFNFASVFTIILTVSLLIIAGVLLWKTGALEHLIEVCRGLMH